MRCSWSDFFSFMPCKLTLEEQKFILKQHWKTENVQDVICEWHQYFDTDPPTCLAIYQLWDKFNKTGSVVDALHSGWLSVYWRKFDYSCWGTCQKPKEITLHGSVKVELSIQHAKTCNVVWQWDMANKDRGYKENAGVKWGCWDGWQEWV